ncbi:hypothetical protein CROQUDRAFT_656781, partial [Cronartium quercuum f. sp. fusiforme G11]
MDFMLPILTRIEEATQMCQSDAPTKHCVIPVYKLIEHTLSQYSLAPGSWGQACQKVNNRLQKYLKIKVQNSQTLLCTILKPICHQAISSHCGFPIAIKNEANLGATVADTNLTDMPKKFDEVKSYLAGENSAQAGEAIGAFWM